MKIHELKCWSPWFEQVTHETKKFEVRKDDREFEIGDVLHLRLYDPKTKKYQGCECLVFVQVVWRNIVGLEKGYCIMSIQLLYKNYP